jgi:hypothetical protein
LGAEFLGFQREENALDQSQMALVQRLDPGVQGRFEFSLGDGIKSL